MRILKVDLAGAQTSAVRATALLCALAALHCGPELPAPAGARRSGAAADPPSVRRHGLSRPEAPSRSPVEALQPGVCSVDKWCWQNPLPFGGRLAAIWGSDANNAWAVGSGGTIVRWNGTAWRPEASGTTNPLYGIFGTDASNAWAVGANGTIV